MASRIDDVLDHEYDWDRLAAVLDRGIASGHAVLDVEDCAAAAQAVRAFAGYTLFARFARTGESGESTRGSDSSAARAR